MSTLTLAGLTDLLASFSLTTPIPTFTQADPLTRPLDLARIYYAQILQQLVEGCEADHAWNSIAWPADIYNGDLAAVLPRLLGHKAAGKDGWPVLAFGMIQKVFPISRLLSYVLKFEKEK